MRVNGVYYFRQRVPRDLIPMLGRRWIKESLRTKDAKLAKALNAKAAAEHPAEWERLRKKPDRRVRHAGRLGDRRRGLPANS